MARARVPRASPLSNPAFALRRSTGLAVQSTVNSVRSSRPISLRVFASTFCRGYAVSRRIKRDGAIFSAFMEAASLSVSSQFSSMIPKVTVPSMIGSIALYSALPSTA